jgi:hypothetical protein
MDADQTYNSIAFIKSWDKDGISKRQSNTRGINTPDVMTIQSQDYVDSVTKLPGRRYTCKLTRVDVDANLATIQSHASMTFNVPSTVTSAQFAVLVATFRAMVADADHIEDILNNES